MLSISSIKGDSAYYSHEDNYYASGSLESRWLGDGAEKLGLKGEVANADMDAIRQGKLPDGTDLSRMVNGVNKHRSGYDLTFSAPKSVSMMILIGGDTRLLDAWNRSVENGMKEVEKLISARITDGGKTDTVLTGNMVAALYNHDTSRALDPQIHTHALVFNTTFAEDKWRALASDTRMKTGFGENLYALQVAIGNLVLQPFRQEAEKLGYETVAAGKNGLWELKDVPVAPFSTRSQAISEAAGPDASKKSRDVAALDTRQAKAWADPDLLKAEWRRRLTDEKFDIDNYIGQAQTRAEPPGPAGGGTEDIRSTGQPDSASSARISESDVQKAVSDTISALSEKKVQFTWSEMLAGTVSRLPSASGLFEQARAGIDAAIEEQRLIPLDREKGIFTSDIHLLNELSVHQLARTAVQEQTVLIFPERAHLSEITLLSEAVKSGQPLADVRTEIARQVNCGELIQLDSVSGVGNRVLVPRVAYEMEKTIIRHIAEGKDAVQPLMALTPASVLAGLTAGQREATRTVLENTDRFMAIQGYAGVGKTTQFRAVMGALNTLSESVRPQVIGLGPTHRAVHEMREAGVEARTLASFLSETRLAIQAGETPDFRNVLFLTDESSMVGNRDMAELYQLVTAGGGRMVSSGDTAQLQAISTGLPFRLVQQRSAIDTVVMQEIVRQTPALRPAIESIIAGQVDTSLRQVDDVSPQQVPRQEGARVPGNSVMEIRAPKKDQEQGTPAADGQTLTPEQLSLVRTDIIEAIRDDWMGRTPQAQQQTLVVAELNADRHAINDAIHAARHEKGDTGAEERTFTVLEPLRVPDNALRAAETFAEYTGAVAMMNERYWTMAEVNTEDAVVTLRNTDGESVLISPQQNTSQDISLFTHRDLTLSQGDRVRFTRSDTDRGYVANSLWEVAGFTDDGAISFRQGEQEKIIDPQAMTEDRHIDLAYALTVYGVQGASERFAIALTGTEGGRKRMASLESTYVTLSRAKEHVQVYTDDLAGWSAGARHSNAGQTAHDLLHQKSDHESDTGNRLLATASRLDKTALGRRVLAENDLEGETMARFIAAGRKYPTPYVALPAWTRHGKEAGALLTEIRIEDDGMRVVLSDESRLRGGEDAQFAGLQASRNGQTLIADDAQTALRLAQESPESGVVIRLHGEERLLNAARLTGGRITEPDEVARTVRSVAEAESAAKAEDPITLPPDEQQKLAEAQEKAARELAEQARQELLPAVPGEESTRPEPLLSADEERRLRDGTARGEHELNEAIQEAMADGRGIRQQVREQMLRTEREWVVNVPEKDIELEKTLGGD
ncbi:conjugative relaxase [Enterobacter ludwigii]